MEQTEQFDDRELRTAYLRLWKEALSEFLGWPPGKVEGWSKRYSLMDDTDSIFYHYSALYYVAGLLVPSEVSANGIKAQSKFRAEIETAIHGGDPRFELSDNVNWQAAKERLEQLLSTVGSSLAEIQQQLAALEDET